MNNRDGWSSTWLVERGFQCVGGSPSTPDIWNDIWGDGIVVDNAVENCDDGNTINGDGWSSQCKVEKGYFCKNSSLTISICNAVWGDGLRKGNCYLIFYHTLKPKFQLGLEKWDDGNVLDSDGWSSLWMIDPGYTCTPDIISSKDVCK